MPGANDLMLPSGNEMPDTGIEEKQYISKRTIEFFKDRYFWYITALAFITAIFTCIVTITGLASRDGWQLAFYVPLYRLFYLVSLALAAWRFGVKGGITVCLVLAPLLLSIVVTNLSGPNAWIEIAVIAIGLIFSFLIGKQGEMKLLLEQKTEDLRQKTERLSSEIEQRKQIEIQIRNAADEWRVTFDSIPDLISIHNNDNRIIRMNKPFSGALKSSPEDLIGKKCYEIIHGTKEPPAYCPQQQTLNTGKPTTAEFFEPSLGTYLQVTSSPIMDDKGTIISSVHVARDVTERKRIEEQLILTDRLASIGQLASGIAHEINNPLTSIVGFSQLLMDGNAPDDIKENLCIVHGEAQRASNIVRNLLTFARKHATVKQLSQINNIIEDVLRVRDYEQKVNNIEVVKNFTTDLPEIMVDYFQMQQVFLNIVVNAENAMLDTHGTGILTITTERFNHTIRVSFADNGPGISKENLTRMFSPFFTTKEVGKGTGLGLSICQGIVSEHGGQVYAESEPGKGAKFIVELPINGR